MAFNDDLATATAALDAAHQSLVDANVALAAATAAQADAQTKRDAAVAQIKAVADQA